MGACLLLDFISMLLDFALLDVPVLNVLVKGQECFIPICTVDRTMKMLVAAALHAHGHKSTTNKYTLINNTLIQ